MIMSIRAILRDGIIQPVDPLPEQWRDGQELVVEQPEDTPAQSELDEWQRELDVATARIPQEEHDRFEKALNEIERESKDAVN